MTAGYSGKPLSVKLGIKPGARMRLCNPPADFGGLLEPLPENVSRPAHRPYDLTVFFTLSHEELSGRFPELIVSTVENGAIWISWPKKSSGVACDLNENMIRDIGLAAGVVDVKVCAVDETWSGLKFVRRLVDRKK
jgi:hypothetical protein